MKCGSFCDILMPVGTASSESRPAVEGKSECMCVSKASVCCGGGAAYVIGTVRRE